MLVWAHTAPYNGIAIIGKPDSRYVLTPNTRLGVSRAHSGCRVLRFFRAVEHGGFQMGDGEKSRCRHLGFAYVFCRFAKTLENRLDIAARSLVVIVKLFNLGAREINIRVRPVKHLGD